MKDIVVYGAGGFGREVAYLIEAINTRKKQWKLLGFIDDTKEIKGEIINGYKVLGGIEWFKEREKNINAILAVGSPKSKKIINNKLKKYSNIEFPILIHPSINIHNTNTIDEGTIICEGSILTTNIKIGKHVIVNLDCTIGHDAIIEKYSTILPGVNISGNVDIEESVMIGTGSSLIEEIKVGKETIVGAGAVVTKDIPQNAIAVGMPAEKIKDNKFN